MTELKIFSCSYEKVKLIYSWPFRGRKDQFWNVRLLSVFPVTWEPVEKISAFVTVVDKTKLLVWMSMCKYMFADSLNSGNKMSYSVVFNINSLLVFGFKCTLPGSIPYFIVFSFICHSFLFVQIIVTSTMYLYGMLSFYTCSSQNKIPVKKGANS
jgi:hypothetical protein